MSSPSFPSSSPRSYLDIHRPDFDATWSVGSASVFRVRTWSNERERRSIGRDRPSEGRGGGVHAGRGSFDARLPLKSIYPHRPKPEENVLDRIPRVVRVRSRPNWLDPMPTGRDRPGSEAKEGRPGELGQVSLTRPRSTRDTRDSDGSRETYTVRETRR